MAVVNILKANYTGSIGNTTGVELHGENVVKAKIWSKAPANPTQKNSVRSFESLNRICGIMARKWGAWLPVKKGNMLLHNALAKYFKDVVKDHTFDVPAFQEYADGTSSIDVQLRQYSKTTGKLKIRVKATLQDFETGLESWCVIVCDYSGHIMLFEVPKGTEYETEQIVGCQDPRQVYVICFASSKRGGRPRFTACTAIPRAWDGIWYTSTTQSVIQATFNSQQNLVQVETTGMRVENGILYTTV